MDKNQLYDCGCSQDCEEDTLPAVNFADCATGVTDELSEISELFMDDIVTNEGTGDKEFANLPTDVTGASPGWYGSARVLRVIGDLAAAENTQRTINNGWVKFGDSTWNNTIDILDATQENYEFVRHLQCNKGKKVGIAWKTMGGYIYGTAIATVISADWLLNRGEDSYVAGQIVLQIKAKCLPTREVDPEMSMAA